MEYVRDYKIPISASAASMCSVVLGSPFDALKVRMQTEYHASTWSCLKSIFINDGIHGFFRGILPPLVTVNIVKTLSVSVYEGTRQKLNSGASSNSGLILGYFASGYLAGLSTSLISCPLEMIRNQRLLWDSKISQSSSTPTSSVRAGSIGATAMPRSQSSLAYFLHLKQLGIVSGVYRGYFMHFLRETIGTGAYWTIYECLHWLPIVSTDGTRKGGHGLAHFLAGGVTGMTAWLIIFPCDLIKNVYQRQVFSSSPPQSLFECIKITFKSHGIFGFYHGVWPTMLRAFPIHGMNLLIYEYLLHLLSR